MNRKITSIITALAMSACVLAGCGSADAADVSVSDKGGSISIITTTFPVYDWLRNVTEGTGAEVTILEDSGADLHNFQPTAEDIVKIKSGDLFVYIGGESDEWAEKLLEEDPSIYSINLLDALGDKAKMEEDVEGAEAEEEEEEEEYDEHIWLSLRNAKICCNSISEALCNIDPDNKDAYTTNSETYEHKLEALDLQYKNMAGQAKTNTLLFADRYPFMYMADDYGLKCYAAFSGCSAETEASFETITFLAGKVDENSLDHIAVLEGSDCRIADTILDNAEKKNVSVVVLDSMQNITRNDIDDGRTYLGIMEDNLLSLETALN